MGLMSHTVLAGRVRVGGRPWGDGETLLVPVGQEGLKMELSGGDYAVVLTVYHQLARAPKGAQPAIGRVHDGASHGCGHETGDLGDCDGGGPGGHAAGAPHSPPRDVAALEADGDVP